jgi:hypothetical protein
VSRVEHYNPTAGRQKLREMIAEALPICATVFSRVAELYFPIVQVATRGRPDVADLPRVHQVDGPEGDVWSQWILINGQGPLWALLDVEVQRPVTCRFRLAFRSDKHRQLLEVAAASGLLGLATGPLHVGSNGMIRGPAIVIQTANPEYLQAFLAIADSARPAWQAA